MKVFVSVTVTVPAVVVVVNIVPVLIVLFEDCVLSVVTPVWVVVCPTDEVIKLVVVLVERMDV